MEWFGSFFDWLWCLLKALINLVLDTLAFLYKYSIGYLVELLPDTPFDFEPIEWGIFGHSIGYFFPVAKMVQHFIAILASVGMYYGIRHLLKLIRMVK